MRDPEGGWMAGMAVVVVTVLMLVASITATAVEASARTTRRNGDGLVAREAALSGAELFFAAIDAVPAASWLPQCAVSGGGQNCTPGPDLFPTSLDALTGARWVQLTDGGVLPCDAGVPPITTCIRMRDQVAVETGASPQAPLSQIALQVDAMTNCRSGSWRADTVPTHCVYARVLERFTPRLYVDYLDYTGSELLDPALATDGDASYPAWLAGCTSGMPPEPLPDTVAASTRPHLCPTPAYLGAGTVAGAAVLSPGDELAGPVATNDQTVYSCNTAGSPPAADGLEAVSPAPSTELPASVTDPAAPCAGPPPPGLTVAASPPPPDTSALASDAAPADRLGTPAAPVDVRVTLSGATPAGSGYSVDGGAVRPWPSTGVLYVNGSVSMDGQACLPLTVGASGSIDVVGNLVRAPNCPRAVIGLIAGNQVSVVPAVVHGQIACWAHPVASQCMTVQAAVLALGTSDLPAAGTPAGGSFNLDGWDVDASPLGAGGACRFDDVVGQDMASDFWLLTDATTGSEAWSGTGLSDPGAGTGGLRAGVTPGPLACDPTSTAMDFAGSAPAYVTTPVASAPPSPTSVAAWFETSTSSGGGGPLVALGEDRSPLKSGVSTDQLWVGPDGTVHAGALDASGTPVTVSSPAGTDDGDGRWHLAVATFGPAGISLFVDGRLVAAGAQGTAPAEGYWWIGAMAAGGWPDVAGVKGDLDSFQGALGRVAVFPYALTLGQVAGLYNAAQQDPDRCAGIEVCALVFDGSFYERFRGAFGTYGTSAAGPVTDTGILKRFSFDATLASDEPPDFFEPVSGGWLRSGVSETAELGA